MRSPVYYFAYGSNLLYRRIALRIGECTVHGMARIPGYQLAFHKSGHDGSGKCDAVRTDDVSHELLGAIYRISTEQQSKLDCIEGAGFGYESKSCPVELGAENLSCNFYVAHTEYVDHSLMPYTWYKDLVIHGARQHGFPESYISKIQAVQSVEDPDEHRHRQNAAILLNPDL